MAEESCAEDKYTTLIRLLSLLGLGNGSAVDLMDSMLSMLGSDEGGFLFCCNFLTSASDAGDCSPG